MQFTYALNPVVDGLGILLGIFQALHFYLLLKREMRIWRDVLRPAGFVSDWARWFCCSTPSHFCTLEQKISRERTQ